MKKQLTLIVISLFSLVALAQDPRPRRTTSDGTVIGGGSHRTSNGQGPHPQPGPTPVPTPMPEPTPERSEYKYDCEVVMVKNEIYGRRRTLYTYTGLLDEVGSCRSALIRCRADVASEMVKDARCWQVLDRVDI